MKFVSIKCLSHILQDTISIGKLRDLNLEHLRYGKTSFKLRHTSTLAVHLLHQILFLTLLQLCLCHVEANQLIFRENQITDFYMMEIVNGSSIKLIVQILLIILDTFPCLQVELFSINWAHSISMQYRLEWSLYIGYEVSCNKLERISPHFYT